MKKIVTFLFSAIFLGFVDCYAAVSDFPTLEAFIILHKECAKHEKTARDNVTQISGTQALTTNVVDKFNNVRMTLNSKMECAGQWMEIATSLFSTATDIYDIIGEVKDFTIYMPKYIGAHPACAIIYSDAILKLDREVKHSLKVIAKLELSAANILRADMKQRLNMIYSIQCSIQRCRNILKMAEYKCIGLTYKGKTIQLMDFDLVFNSQTMKEIANKVRNGWKHGKQ